MKPIPVPPEAAATRSTLKAIIVGPPPGVSDDQCESVEALAGQLGDWPVYCDYWKPTPEELEKLNNGGFIELIQYVPRMVMHSMHIWSATEEPKDD